MATSGSTIYETNCALTAHIDARAAVHARPTSLKWSEDLADDAQHYAEYLASTGRLEHSKTSDGENLAYAYPSLRMVDAVEMWLEEKKNYNGEAISMTNLNQVGHYTACIWPKTTHVGMGRARGRIGDYVVARYRPVGNILGHSAYTGKRY